MLRSTKQQKALFKAVVLGHLQDVEDLLNAIQSSEDKKSLITAKLSSQDIDELLMGCKSEEDARSVANAGLRVGQSVLQVASLQGYTQIAERLLIQQGLFPESDDSDNSDVSNQSKQSKQSKRDIDLAFQLAWENKHFTTAKMLLRRGAKSEITILQVKEKHKEKRLEEGLRERDETKVDKFLEYARHNPVSLKLLFSYLAIDTAPFLAKKIFDYAMEHYSAEEMRSLSFQHVPDKKMIEQLLLELIKSSQDTSNLDYLEKCQALCEACHYWIALSQIASYYENNQNEDNFHTYSDKIFSIYCFIFKDDNFDKKKRDLARATLIGMINGEIQASSNENGELYIERLERALAWAEKSVGIIDFVDELSEKANQVLRNRFLAGYPQNDGEDGKQDYDGYLDKLFTSYYLLFQDENLSESQRMSVRDTLIKIIFSEIWASANDKGDLYIERLKRALDWAEKCEGINRFAGALDEKLKEVLTKRPLTIYLQDGEVNEKALSELVEYVNLCKAWVSSNTLRVVAGIYKTVKEDETEQKDEFFKDIENLINKKETEETAEKKLTSILPNYQEVLLVGDVKPEEEIESGKETKPAEKPETNIGASTSSEENVDLSIEQVEEISLSDLPAAKKMDIPHAIIEQVNHAINFLSNLDAIWWVGMGVFGVASLLFPPVVFVAIFIISVYFISNTIWQLAQGFMGNIILELPQEKNNSITPADDDTPDVSPGNRKVEEVKAEVAGKTVKVEKEEGAEKEVPAEPRQSSFVRRTGWSEKNSPHSGSKHTLVGNWKTASGEQETPAGVPEGKEFYQRRKGGFVPPGLDPLFKAPKYTEEGIKRLPASKEAGQEEEGQKKKI